MRLPSPGSCLSQQLAAGLACEPGMWLPRASWAPGPACAVSFLSDKIFTRPKYRGSTTALQQSDPTCLP